MVEDAKLWWKITKKTFKRQEEDITWTFFKKKKKILRDHIKDRKKEFETKAE